MFQRTEVPSKEKSLPPQPATSTQGYPEAKQIQGGMGDLLALGSYWGQSSEAEMTNSHNMGHWESFPRLDSQLFSCPLLLPALEHPQ